MLGRLRFIKVINNTKYSNIWNRTMIQHCTLRQIKLLFNALPYALQGIANLKAELFKKKLNLLLQEISDTPKINEYQERQCRN